YSGVEGCHIYGLKQAPRAWYSKLESHLAANRDLDDRKSTSGYDFMLGDGVISWASKKQPMESN
ncbi:hypothetical protein CR513_56274, partial [Mucuna pruriens]